MIDIEKYFLKTGMSQKAVAESLVETLNPILDECVYNVKRYNTPISLILFYTENDISDLILEYKRLTDVAHTIKLKGSYFNFVVLPFTDLQDSFTLIGHIEYNVSTKIKVLSSAAEIESGIHNYYNFINSYLIEIAEKDKGNILAIL